MKVSAFLVWWMWPVVRVILKLWNDDVEHTRVLRLILLTTSHCSLCSGSGSVLAKMATFGKQTRSQPPPHDHHQPHIMKIPFDAKRCDYKLINTFVCRVHTVQGGKQKCRVGNKNAEWETKMPKELGSHHARNNEMTYITSENLNYK